MEQTFQCYSFSCERGCHQDVDNKASELIPLCHSKPTCHILCILSYQNQTYIISFSLTPQQWTIRLFIFFVGGWDMSTNFVHSLFYYRYDFIQHLFLQLCFPLLVWRGYVIQVEPFPIFFHSISFYFQHILCQRYFLHNNYCSGNILLCTISVQQYNFTSSKQS